MRLFIVVLTCIFFNLPASGQSSVAPFAFTKAHKKAYQHYLRLEFELGYQKLEETDTENGNTLYLKSYYDWFRLLIAGKESELDAFEEKLEARIERLESYNSDSPYFRFLQAELYLHLSTAQLYFERRWPAIWNVRRAYKLLQKNAEEHPDFLTNHKSLGLLEVLFGAVPDKYQWALSLIGLKGKIESGLYKLRQLRDSASPFAPEAGMVHAMLRTHVLGEEKEAAQETQYLYATYPRMKSVAFVRTITLLRAQQHEKARALLKRLQHGSAAFTLPHWAYMRAETELHLGNFAEARPFYFDFLQSYQGEHFIKDTYYKLYLSEWLAGKAFSENWLQKVREAGKAITDADRHALRFANRDKKPHPKLMQARLLTDGGRYQKALRMTNQMDISRLRHPIDRTEWWYRRARIWHQQDSTDKAIPAYQKAVVLGKTLPYHFAANACLQLGYIFAERGEKARARYYFERVPEFDDHAYHESLKQKAKAGLHRL